MRAIDRAMAVLFAWIPGVLTRLSGTGKKISAPESTATAPTEPARLAASQGPAAGTSRCPLGS